jgi:predicted transposase YbfD/YdcC
MLQLRGALVTIDALGRQTAIVQEMNRAEADYVLQVKGNQPTLLADWQLNLTFREDDFRLRTRHTCVNFGTLRRAALTPLTNKST